MLVLIAVYTEIPLYIKYIYAWFKLPIMKEPIRTHKTTDAQRQHLTDG